MDLTGRRVDRFVVAAGAVVVVGAAQMVDLIVFDHRRSSIWERRHSVQRKNYRHLKIFGFFFNAQYNQDSTNITTTTKKKQEKKKKIVIYTRKELMGLCDIQ